MGHNNVGGHSHHVRVIVVPIWTFPPFLLRLDNTEYMRNGDYHPTRLEAQKDAAQLLIQTKLRSNVENAVAIMTMGGPSYRICLIEFQIFICV